MEEEEYNVGPLKSLVCEKFSLITFYPRTDRTVNIFWLDYNGTRVKYGTVCRGSSLQVTTFETHPWVFYDAETEDSLVTSGGAPVYYPKPWAGQESVAVYIDIPVYTLKERCLQVVRSLYNISEIENHMIPYTLKVELGEKQNVPFKMYTNYQPLV